MEKNRDVKKNLLKIIGCTLGIVLVLGLSFILSKNYGSNIDEIEFNPITIDEYLNTYLKSEDKKIVYVARPTCSYCQKEEPILKKLTAKYGLDVNYLDTSNFFDAELEDYTEEGYKFIKSSPKYEDGYGTPNTIIVQNGEIVDGVFQYVESKELKDLFVRNGFINE